MDLVDSCRRDSRSRSRLSSSKRTYVYKFATVYFSCVFAGFDAGNIRTVTSDAGRLLIRYVARARMV